MSITITPLSAHPLPPTYLLTVDNAQILLDCGSYDKGREATLPFTSTSAASADAGADEPTSEQVAEYLATLRKVAPSLNLVLLSHPLLTSLGLLPFLRARCGMRCPVYGTLPTREMGRYAVEEWVEARSAAEKNEIRYEALEQALGASKRKDAAVAHAAAAKKRKGKAKVEAAEVGVGEDVMVVKEEEVDGDADAKGPAVTKQETGDKPRDPWADAWKLTTQEIRDAFLAINAVRWTQPIHLTGPPTYRFSRRSCLPCFAQVISRDTRLSRTDQGTPSAARSIPFVHLSRPLFLPPPPPRLFSMLRSSIMSRSITSIRLRSSTPATSMTTSAGWAS